MNQSFKKAIISAVSIPLLAPIAVFAQTGPNLGPFTTLLTSIQSLVNQAIPVAAGIALLGFFFGLAKYIFQAGDEEAQDEGKRIMIWGVISLFLIAAVGGIVDLLAQAFGTGTGKGIDPSQIKNTP